MEEDDKEMIAEALVIIRMAMEWHLEKHQREIESWRAEDEAYAEEFGEEFGEEPPGIKRLRDRVSLNRRAIEALDSLEGNQGIAEAYRLIREALETHRVDFQDEFDLAKRVEANCAVHDVARETLEFAEEPTEGLGYGEMVTIATERYGLDIGRAAKAATKQWMKSPEAKGLRSNIFHSKKRLEVMDWLDEAISREA